MTALQWTPELAEFVSAGVGAWIFGFGAGMLWRLALGWGRSWLT